MQLDTASSMAVSEYDRQWKELDDFIRLNPAARHRRRWLLHQLRGMDFQQLLDVGCGNGELLIAIKFANRKAKLTGVDFSPVVIERDKQRLPLLEFHVLDVERERLSNSFEVIVCSEVIEHVTDQKAAFHNLAAMLQPGGTLLLTCPTGKIYPTERHFGHTKHPNLEDLRYMAGEEHLEIMEASNWGFPFHPVVKWVTNIDAEWALEKFGHVPYSNSSRFISYLLYYVYFLNTPSSPFGCQLMLRLKKSAG